MVILRRAVSFLHRLSSKSVFGTTNSNRLLFSAAYSCNQEWEARKASPVLKNVDIYSFMAEMQRYVQRGFKISAVDVDVALNCINDSDQLEDTVKMIYKLRHSPLCVDMMESTHSAFVRVCMQLGQDDLLLKILDDPLNYGVFIDSFDGNLYMNHFLKNGNHRDAVKIASKLMLQEDFSRRSSCWISVLSCLKWLKEPQPHPWQPVQETEQADDEEIIFRFPFLKNHFFDDHFDIVEPQTLVGKTLAWMGSRLQNKQLSQNIMALGYLLKKDYASVIPLLRLCLASKAAIYKEIIDRTKPSELKADAIADDQQPTAEESKEPVEEPPVDSAFLEVEALLGQFEKAGLIIEDDLTEDVADELGKLMPEFEAEDLKDRRKTIARWNELREQSVENQISMYLKQERLREIAKERQELLSEREYLTFFENRNKIERSIHPELLRLEQETRDKAKSEEQQLPSDDKYVIPDISSRRDAEKISF